jgi:LmbE family N-acetylglucosaminyl deacetylase
MTSKKLRIIAIGAHIDDIEIACGGTIAKAVDNGHSVKMLVLSQSGYTHYDGTELRNAQNAVNEGEKAAETLGVKDLEILDFPVKDIPYNSSVVEAINLRLDEFKPDLIFTHWTFDTHQSHRNTALATISAARYYTSLLMYEPIPPAGRSYIGYRAQYYVDITEYIEKKIASLRAHKSEYKKYGEQWINAVKARALYRGFELISYENKEQVYAESFEIVRLKANIFT